MYCVNNYPLRSMASKLDISHNEVAKRLQAAEGFIEGGIGLKLDRDKIIRKHHTYSFA